EQAHIHNVLIPDALNEKNKRTQEIDHKKMQMEQGKIESQYSKTRFILFSVLTCIIALYLIFFYASAMNAAFFRSMEMLVNSSDTNDISLMLNSIFDARGIFVVSPHL